VKETDTSFRDLTLGDIKPLIDGGDYDVVDVREVTACFAQAGAQSRR